jgi:adenylate kinase
MDHEMGIRGEATRVRLILIGAPGSGKGTQAELLKEHLKLHHLSTGEMLRTAVARGTELGRRVEAIMKNGGLVPDEIVIGLIRERLEDPDIAKAFLMDGFPRTLAQARALNEILEEKRARLDRVLLFEVPAEMIVERITGRRGDPKTGKIYHLTFNPPPPEVVSRLVHRADDKEEAVRERLAEYHAQTQQVIPFYDTLGILRRIDGTRRPHDVFQQILRVLSEIP